MKKYPYSISFKVPLTLILIGTAGLVLAYFLSIFYINSAVEQKNLDDMLSSSNFARNTLIKNLATNSTEQSVTALSQFTKDPLYTSALVVSSTGLVLASSNPAWQHIQLEEIHPEFSRNKFDSLYASHELIKGGDALLFFFPLPPSNRFLMIQRTLLEEKQGAYAMALQIFTTIFLILLPFGVFIWVFLDRVFTKKIRHLVDVTKVITEGDLDARSVLTGNDELSTLGNTINLMTENIQNQYSHRIKHDELVLHSEQLAMLGTIEYDIKTKQSKFSKQAALILEIEDTNAELNLDQIAHSIHPKYRHQVFEVVPKALASSTPIHLETVVVLSNGDQRWLSVQINTLRNDKGEPTQLISVIFDITDKKEAEQKLIDSENKLNALIKNIPGRVLVLSLEGTVLFVSLDIPYNKRLQIKGKQLIDFVGENYRQLFTESMEFVRTTLEMTSHETCTEINGETQWWLMRMGPMTEDGILTGFAISSTDITEKKQAEILLYESNRSLKTLSTCNLALVQAHSEQEYLDRVCRTVTENYGYSLAWVGYKEYDEGKTVRPIATSGLPPDVVANTNLSWGDNEYGSGIIGTSIKEKKPWIYDEEDNSNPNYAEWRELFQRMMVRMAIAIPIMNEGECIGVFAIYTQELKAMDNAQITFLTELTDDINFGIQSFRAETERKQLQTQLQRGQKLQSIGELTGGIAHDFNNILGSVLGYTALAIEEINDPNSRCSTYLNEVTQAGERARNLVVQMLSFSRSNSGSPVYLAPISMVEEVLKLLKSTMPSGITIDAEFEEPVPDILVDPTQLHQMLMNLCINARDAVDEKGRIIVRVYPQQTSHGVCSSCQERIEGEYLCISISDNGHGIAKEHLERIFDPFFSTKEAGKGSGMGLSVVHGIIHENNGHIDISTSPEKGTTITLMFKNHRNRSSGVEPVTLPQPIDQISATPSGAATIEILVVDDEEPLAEYLRLFLTNKGFSVTATSSSLAALNVFAENPNRFGLVITDMNMPGLNGSELAKSIWEIRADTRVILCSGYSNQINPEKATEQGFDGYFAKPINTRLVLARIEQLMEDLSSATM